MSLLSRCRIVLVRTHFPGNLGSAARAMHNFGLTDLVLVDPLRFPDDLEARRLAAHGVGILDAARIVPDLGEALGDCVFTLATSGLADGVVRQTFAGSPREKFPHLLRAAAMGPVAIVFGPEPHGLSNAEVTRCHGLVRIPVNPEAPSLNLAQSVAVCCYELFQAVAECEAAVPEQSIATFADQERMFAHLAEAFESIGYLYGTKAGPLLHAMRHLIGRSMPTPQEVRMLHGLARQILWASSQVPPRDVCAS